jgi:hypothetical protein
VYTIARAVTSHSLTVLSSLPLANRCRNVRFHASDRTAPVWLPGRNACFCTGASGARSHHHGATIEHISRKAERHTSRGRERARDPEINGMHTDSPRATHSTKRPIKEPSCYVTIALSPFLPFFFLDLEDDAGSSRSPPSTAAGSRLSITSRFQISMLG